MDSNIRQQGVLLAYGRQVCRESNNQKEKIYAIIKAKSRYEKYKRTGHIHGMKKWKKIMTNLENDKTENI